MNAARERVDAFAAQIAKIVDALWRGALEILR